MKNVEKVENAGVACVFREGSLKASLLKVLRLVESDQGHSDQVIKEWCHAECSFCHAELDSASHVVVRHVKRKVGKIPNQVWNDNSPIGEGNGINSITNLLP